MGQATLPVQVRQRRSRRKAVRRHPKQLHVLTFQDLAAAMPAAGFRQAATVLVRGRMGQAAAIGLARERARELGQGVAFCTGVRTVPALRTRPGLDKLTAKHTAFPSFLALLTAAGSYRPSIRLDLLGRDGLVLALAYDRQQAAWGDPRRAFVSGDLPAAAGRAGA